MFAPGTSEEAKAAAGDDLEVLACMLTCALHLARRAHNLGALVDLGVLQTVRDQAENARVEAHRARSADPLDELAR